MTVALAVLLFANAAFNVIAWPNFYRRVARDPRARDAAGKPTRFLAVHTILVAVALVLAVLSTVGAVLALAAG